MMTDHDKNSKALEDFHPAYFQVEFITDSPKVLPENFAIITGYATTGEIWTDELNKKADEALFTYLLSLGSSPIRLTGFSPENGHSEPGWAVDIDWKVACDIGQKFKQDAIFFVNGEKLYLSKCNDKRWLTYVGKLKVQYRER